MRKIIYLLAILFIVVVSCKKNKSSDVEFIFTKVEGNKISATNGVVKLQWEDTKNTQWNIIEYNLTDGTQKTIPTTIRSISDNIDLNKEYYFVPVGNSVIIDTTNACRKDAIKTIVSTMPDLFTTFKPCPSSQLSLISVFAEKISATQGTFNAGFASIGNTSWKVKVTNTATSTSNTTNTVITETGNINIPLDVTQAVEITGDQNGAKASFNVRVNSDANVIVSDF